MKIYLLISALFLFVFTAQASNNPTKIIGDNDLVPVNADGSNIPLKYRPLIDAFGMMEDGCTMTHIGNGYVLTAGHCFWASEEPTQNQDCAQTVIKWGYRQGIEPYMTSICQKIIYAVRDGANDFAVIQVSPVPPVAIAPDLNRRAATGDTVTIFSHPQKRSLEWSRLCGVEVKQHPDLPNGSIQHECDTEPGSSGATIINALTLKVVGIHDGGLDAGYDPEHPDSPLATGMNYGTYILNSPLGEILRSLGFN